jgi:hypothetical protein
MAGVPSAAGDYPVLPEPHHNPEHDSDERWLPSANMQADRPGHEARIGQRRARSASSRSRTHASVATP